MLMDYARCIYFESRNNPVRALRVASDLLLARTKHQLGPLHYSLFRLASTPRRTWRDYIRETEFFSRVIRYGNPEHVRQVVNDKLLFYQHCVESGLPTFPIICMVGHSAHPAAGRAITYVQNLDQWSNALASAPEELFVKPINASLGYGTFTIRGSGQDFLFGRPETRGSMADLYHYVWERVTPDTALLVQPRVKPHPEILRISSPNGLSTARVVTASVNNRIEVPFACARLSVGTNTNDNFSHGMTGNLAAAIDVNSGMLSEAWGSSRHDWPLMRSVDRHPDTGNRIGGAVVPLWSEVVELVREAHQTLPQLKTIGWDIAITDSGPRLIEANCAYNIDILQVTHQRGLDKELVCLIESQVDQSDT